MKADTRKRILDAAEAAFAAEGWLGATTQQIARAAEVNEVTLFRHFGTKKALFGALIGRFIEGRRELIDQAILEHAPMEEVLARLAERQHRAMLASAGFIRTLLGEMHRHPEEVREVVHETTWPLREQMLGLLRSWQTRGVVRPEIDCEAALDLFSAMLFGQAIKATCSGAHYTNEKYRELAVAVFIRGLRP